jgi:hypothetical protein
MVHISGPLTFYFQDTLQINFQDHLLRGPFAAFLGEAIISSYNCLVQLFPIQTRYNHDTMKARSDDISNPFQSQSFGFSNQISLASQGDKPRSESNPLNGIGF